MESFQIIDPYLFDGNIFKMLDKDWMLITAGTADDFNTMTASWGGFGILWKRPVCFTFIRPTRYTYDFANKNKGFSLSFFGGGQRKELNLLGTLSGRDTNKIKRSGLTPVTLDSGNISFREAKVIMDCEKIYFNDILNKNFLDPAIETLYNNNDYHRMFIGEIKTIMKSI